MEKFLPESTCSDSPRDEVGKYQMFQAKQFVASFEADLSNSLPSGRRNPDETVSKGRLSSGEVDKTDPGYVWSTENFCPRLQAEIRPTL